MAPRPEDPSPRRRSTASGSPVQPGDEQADQQGLNSPDRTHEAGACDLDASAVPAGWLQEAALARAAERVDRLAADNDLITSLALARFEGPDYDYFENELAKYGLAVMRGWMRRRLILVRCRERGFGGLPEPPAGAFDDPDVVQELANETVAKALYHFRVDVLMRHRWDYRRGASLRTFFVGQCLMRFANIYRAWWSSEARGLADAADHETLDILQSRPVPSVEQLVVDSVQAIQALRTVRDPRVREAMLLKARGLSAVEIGGRLGVTEKAVERMIANERQRLRGRGIA